MAPPFSVAWLSINFRLEPGNSLTDANSSNAIAPPYTPVLFLKASVAFSRILILPAVIEMAVPSFLKNVTFEVILIIIAKC